MVELINLRMARKRAKQRQDDLRAATHRLAYGQPKHRRKLAAAQKAKATRDLDRHKVDKGDAQ
jgi:HAMP domain-containing protein